MRPEYILYISGFVNIVNLFTLKSAKDLCQILYKISLVIGAPQTLTSVYYYEITFHLVTKRAIKSLKI